MKESRINYCNLKNQPEPNQHATIQLLLNEPEPAEFDEYIKDIGELTKT